MPDSTINLSGKPDSLDHKEEEILKPCITSLKILGNKTVQITPVYNTYWQFATERQNIFFARLKNPVGPWTDDEILQKYKFTNVYRASDRVSQFLIRNVIYSEDAPTSAEDIFFRILLFKIFNKIETWKLLEHRMGGTICISDFSVKKYCKILGEAKKNDQTIYSAAYMMPSGVSAFGYAQKHENHLYLIDKMVKDELPAKIADSKSMHEVFELIDKLSNYR